MFRTIRIRILQRFTPRRTTYKHLANGGGGT
jgi:hypothetical protein